MDQLMNNIKNIPGVVGVAVFKDNGSLVAFDFPEAYDRNLINQMGLKFQPIKEILPQDEGEIVYLCWEYENLLGFYYPVARGWVNIISSDQVPMPVFSLTMTAVSNKLPKLLEEAEPLQVKGQEGPAPGTAKGTVPPEKVKELKEFFSIYLGPVAPVVFKRVSHRLGFTVDNVPEDRLKSLLDGMVDKVPDNKKAEVMEKVKKYY